MMSKWVLLGEGNFNKVYRSEDGSLVLKIEKKTATNSILLQLDSPERSVRLWNAFYPNLSPAAQVYESELGLGWTCPFIEGETPNDKEIANALIDIFNLTGRIVVDAIAPNNFKKTKDGSIVCVDIGLALQLVKQEQMFFYERRKSALSLSVWKKFEFTYVADYYANHHSIRPKSIDILMSLILIKTQRSDIRNVDFLKNNPELPLSLYKLYYELCKIKYTNHENKVIKLMAQINEILDILDHYSPIELKEKKSDCIGFFTKHLQSQGKLSLKTEDMPSPLTNSLLNKEQIISFDTNEIENIIRQIDESNSLEEIGNSLQAVKML